MADSKDLMDLLDFYLYSDLNDNESLDKYLYEENIDIDLTAENLKDFIHHKRAELKLANGRKLKESYLQAINSELLKDSENEDYATLESEMISAFRKASGNYEKDEADIKDDIKKIVLLKKLSRQKENPDSSE